VPAVKYKELVKRPDRKFRSVRERVLARETFNSNDNRDDQNVYANAQMPPKLIRKHCAISPEGEKLLENAIQKLVFPRARNDRILKFREPSRTIERSFPPLPPNT